MKIIGCDFHTRYQQIAMLDEATGELIERRLEHEDGEAHRFYRNLPRPVRVGVEATGPLHWFESLLAELGHELWIGDSAKIRASEVRKQKTDERDAQLILDLLLRDHFPRIWVPSAGERDLRQLLWYRHKMVRMRTRWLVEPAKSTARFMALRRCAGCRPPSRHETGRYYGSSVLGEKLP